MFDPVSFITGIIIGLFIRAYIPHFVAEIFISWKRWHGEVS